VLSDPDPGFDAVVVGEYERAFSGDQLLNPANSAAVRASCQRSLPVSYAPGMLAPVRRLRWLA
jgi:hypothetical protein